MRANATSLWERRPRREQGCILTNPGEFHSVHHHPGTPMRIFRHAFTLLPLLVAAGLMATARSAAAQLPGPADFPWNAPPGVARIRLQRLGLHESGPVRTVQGDTALTFTATAGAAAAELTARFRAHRLWHAYLVVRGDSAAVQ